MTKLLFSCSIPEKVHAAHFRRRGAGSGDSHYTLVAPLNEMDRSSVGMFKNGRGRKLATVVSPRSTPEASAVVNPVDHARDRRGHGQPDDDDQIVRAFVALLLMRRRLGVQRSEEHTSELQ